MRKMFFYFLFPLLALSISGCLPLIVGGAVGALTVHAVNEARYRRIVISPMTSYGTQL